MTTDDTRTNLDTTQGVPWVYDDGGRRAAKVHVHGETWDSVTRAIAIAVGEEYLVVEAALDDIRRTLLKEAVRRTRKAKFESPVRAGVDREVVDTYMREVSWRRVPLQELGQRRKMHLRYDELPEAALSGSAVLQVSSRHLVAARFGILHDTLDPCRGGTRLLYGYWADEKVLAQLGVTT
jgi:hypothetical protein